MFSQVLAWKTDACNFLKLFHAIKIAPSFSTILKSPIKSIKIFFSPTLKKSSFSKEKKFGVYF